jgi:hypothetical protein
VPHALQHRVVQTLYKINTNLCAFRNSISWKTISNGHGCNYFHQYLSQLFCKQCTFPSWNRNVRDEIVLVIELVSDIQGSYQRERERKRERGRENLKCVHPSCLHSWALAHVHIDTFCYVFKLNLHEYSMRNLQYTWKYFI